MVEINRIVDSIIRLDYHWKRKVWGRWILEIKHYNFLKLIILIILITKNLFIIGETHLVIDQKIIFKMFIIRWDD
jgi:hypothetical protein